MPKSKPLQYGDALNIIHVGGQMKQVEFRGLFGKKLDVAYVKWPMAGEYKAKTKDGILMPRAVSLWRVCDPDLERLQEASRLANAEATENRKRNK